MKSNNINIYEQFKNYDQEFSSVTSDIFFPPEIYKEIEKYLYGVLLDVGTGDGAKLENILKKCKKTNRLEKIIAIDPSPLYETAQSRLKKYNIDVLNCPLEDFQSSFLFDTILLFDVIEHSYDPIQLLNKITSLLKPNGTLILSTPNRQIYNFLEKLIKGKLDPTHVSVMNLTELFALVRKFFQEIKFYGVLPIMKIGRKIPFILAMHKFIAVPFLWNNAICICRLPNKANLNKNLCQLP